MSGLSGFADEPHRRAKGGVGEQAAVEWLARCGYEIVARNVQTPVGEIDVVARDGETLCFIEVKARATGTYGPAIAAVGREKQRRLTRASALYLVRHPHPGPCRFDVLGLDRTEEGWTYTLVRDAFAAA